MRKQEKCPSIAVLTNQILGSLNAVQIRAVFRKLPSTFFISLCLCSGGIALALDKPAAPQPAKDAGDEAGRRIAAETAAVIEALGAHPSARQISNIVFKAVRSSPASVLLIVHAAVRVSPQDAAPGIVTAATAAVPDPWKKVTYHRLTAHDLETSNPDGKQTSDGKGIVNLGGHGPDYKSGPDGKSPAATGDPAMTLAEAIARTAFDAQPGLSLPALQSAVDIALVSDPAMLLRYIQSPRTNTGVGDAGFSNYANEPLRPTIVSGSTTVPAPNPPPVSQ
jgi:hypothetical protein